MITAETISESKVNGNDDLDKTSPVVSLEAFFNGNEDKESFGWFYVEEEQPSLAFTYELLKYIRSRPDVEHVLVEVNNFEIDDIEVKLVSPHTSRLYIITSGTEDKVSQWVEPLMPDFVFEGWGLDDIPPPNAPVVSEGNKVYEVSWLS